MKKILLIFIIFNLLFSGLLVLIPENAKASVSNKLIIDWSLQNAGLTSGYNDNCSYESYDPAGDSKVKNGEGRDGTKAFDLDNYYDVVKLWVNLSDSYVYVTKICIWLEDLSQSNYISFYNSDNTKVLYFKINADAIQYYDAGSGWQILKSTVYGENGWLNITHITGNQMNYTWYEEGGSTVYSVGASNSAEDWDNIDRIYFNSNVSSNGMAMDDLILYYDTELPTDECIDTYYSTINIPEYDGLPVSYGYGQYFEHQYTSFTGLGITGELTKVMLLVSNDQIDHVSNNVNNYTLVVSGTNYGNADLIFESDYLQGYWVQWNMSKYLTADNPIFSFGCNAYYETGVTRFYWYGLGMEDANIWGSKYHNSSAYHTNSIYDGTSYNKDVAYMFYIECAEELEPPEDTNETSTYKDIYFKFFDITTNEILHYKGLSVSSSVMGSLDFTTCLIYSLKSTDGFRHDYSTLDYFTANLNFTEGESVQFSFMGEDYTNFQVRIDNSFYYFKPQTQDYKLYAGQIYYVYLKPIWYVDGVEYINCGYSYPNEVTSEKSYLCINKVVYDYGETIRCEYKLPDAKWLDDNGFYANINQYQLKIYNTEDYTFLLGRRSLFHEAPRIYTFTIPAGHFDNKRHTHEISIEEYNEYGFDEAYYKCEMVIDAIEQTYLDLGLLIHHLYFYVSGQTFEPLGNITSISPNPCYSGQTVQIAFTSNNVGRLEIREPDGNSILFSQPYGYSESVHTINWYCNWEGSGSLPVRLFTYGVDYDHIDSEELVVISSDENETYGWRGYGVPYLYIPERQGNYIAGNSTVYIHYRTYKNNSIILIRSPRSEQTYYSTTVSNQSKNYLAIKCDNFMQIGTWNVTFYCGDIYGTNVTLYTEFNIVNEEGNWVEFTKHTYTTDEAFSIYIKNSYRVSVTFYKNDVAQGESLIYEPNEPDYLTLVPLTKVRPDIGEWRVEMWRINDRNVVYELAEWECNVIAGSITTDVTIQYGINIPSWLKLIIGIAITLTITILPMLLITIINKKSPKSIELPALVYIAFFFFGLVIGVLLGFMPIVVPFIVLLGVTLGFVVMWLRGHPLKG